jgi:Domain of unknown function (DUF4352)
LIHALLLHLPTIPRQVSPTLIDDCKQRNCQELAAKLARGLGSELGRGASTSRTTSGNKEEKKKGAKEKGEETVAIGQPLTMGDVRWVVTDARQIDQLVQQGISARNAKTEQGNYVIVDFAFRNDGSEAITLDNESLKLVDSQGRESGTRAELSSYVPEDRRIFLERINPGVTEQGQAIFEVAPGSSGFRVLAGDARMFSDEEGYVDLGF